MKRDPICDDSFPQSDLFAGVADSDRAAILNQGERIRSGAGDILFNQGDPASRCYLVLKGRLKLTAVHEQGKQAVVRYIGPGQLTGAVAVFKGKDYPVTAETIGLLEGVAWDRQAMVDLMLGYPQLAINMLRVVVDRLDDVQTRYLEITAEQVEKRIARALLRIMRHSGRKTDDGILIDFPVSRQEIADYTGTTLYTVSRILSAWSRKRWIRSGREQITVTDPHALVAFVETC
ncbi:MAG: Crp/Fnr family transcriptional regulator [Deltaproteobacteria bacterium]|nr:Crp/Fnr family transcriptional regulator [Deltaproteobacteria bacterium]